MNLSRANDRWVMGIRARCKLGLCSPKPCCLSLRRGLGVPCPCGGGGPSCWLRPWCITVCNPSGWTAMARQPWEQRGGEIWGLSARLSQCCSRWGV